MIHVHIMILMSSFSKMQQWSSAAISLRMTDYFRWANKCSSTYQMSSWQLFGQPMLLTLPSRVCTSDILYKAFLQRMSWVHVQNNNAQGSHLVWSEVGNSSIVNGKVPVSAVVKFPNERQGYFKEKHLSPQYCRH